ncbi:hypothetical protein Plec18167_005120 [Paecilomyces lecythidis]|uniref:Uncharacterized protein n=1 Tax=Paecilomyces lecythidis TaxID=3004212 RepID=A0ABR3XMD0_9EURO
MRFFAVIAAALAFVAPAVMAQGQNPKNCLPECHVYSRQANCPPSHPAVYREGPGCFQCCESV